MAIYRMLSNQRIGLEEARCRELAATGREDLCQGEMTVHAALIESLLAVPNALWYCSPAFLR